MRSIAAAALIAAVGTSGAACSGPHPSIRSGDANSVEVMYSGDVATALPLAREYCAGFERKAQLVDVGSDTASFSCVRR